MSNILGIRHITVCARGAQEDVDFMVEERLTKQTVLSNGRYAHYQLAMAFIAVAALGLFGSPVFAHHGSNNYDMHTQVTLKGTVTEFMWANPHCQIYFDVTDDKGDVQHWGAEMNNPHALSMLGFSKDTLKSGDKITITGNPAKSGQPRMFFRELVLADGKTLRWHGGYDQNGNPIPEPEAE
jgi:hypothetical protein